MKHDESWGEVFNLFESTNPKEYGDLITFLDDFELEQSELLWFEPQTGIEWIDSLTENLQSDSVNFDKESVLLELDEYRTVLKQAEKNKMKWRFELDV